MQEIDIVNRALQVMGSRTNVSSAELANAFAGAPSGPYSSPISNEAIQASLVLRSLRDELNRMAPWNCVKKWANLTYVTTTPGNPENPNAGAPLWQPGIPVPPWNYEFQYPVDCLRARYVLPQYTSANGGLPIYPSGTVTGAGQVGWTGPALKFAVATDNFFGVTAAVPLGTGLGYSPNDLIVLAQPSYTFQQNSAPVGGVPSITSYTMDAGAPAVLQVLTVGGAGQVLTCAIVNQVQGELTPIGGSYFSTQTNPVAQGSSISATNPGISSGTGETFDLTFGSQAPQRIILCNQEQGILCYNGQVTDPNLMDVLFQDAWIHILASKINFNLAGDKGLSNAQINLANNAVIEARKADGNEGLTVNDVTPDWLRIRGNIGGPNWGASPNQSFDWGGLWSPY